MNNKFKQFSIDSLFEKIKVNKLNFKTTYLPSKPDDIYPLPALTAGIQNQGLNFYVPSKNATILKNVISVSANGANTGAMFYQSNEFTVLQDSYAIDLKEKPKSMSKNIYLYLITCLKKAIYGNYSWTNKAGWEKIKNMTISLPVTTTGSIDFEYMEERISELEEERISELEAYLQVTGFNDYALTTEEQESIDKFNIGLVQWEIYNVEKLFGKSTRGKRLKSADRVSGNLPFVTAGETDEGISAYIGNVVQVFSKNTSTIDMFGSAKYRNYDYGADDHVAIVHTEKLPKHAAMFVTSALHKAAHAGQFDYSRNFYAKDADGLFISLPTKNKQPDFAFMETYIRAIQKLVIKDVVTWKDKIIATTQSVIK